MDAEACDATTVEESNAAGYKNFILIIFKPTLSRTESNVTVDRLLLHNFFGARGSTKY